MITTFQDSSDTDNGQLNNAVVAAQADAEKLQKIEQGGSGDATSVENDLNSKLQGISNLCSQIVGG